jgi:hypothetical protein
MYLFQNALSLDPQNVSTMVLFMAAAAWAGIMFVLLVDLCSDSGLALAWKVLWFPLIVCIPLVSGLLYGAFTFIRRLVGMHRR